MVLLFFVVWCSDAGNAAESHSADYCLGGTGVTRRISDVAIDNGGTSALAACERELSTQRCPIGWLYYKDDGSEGQDSCLFVSSSSASSWAAASASCVPGSHLLTVRSSAASASGLLPFAASLLVDTAMYLGCSQSSTATQPWAGWSWVDGTSANNLNCAGVSCGVWASGSPK